MATQTLKKIILLAAAILVMQLLGWLFIYYVETITPQSKPIHTVTAQCLEQPDPESIDNNAWQQVTLPFRLRDLGCKPSSPGYAAFRYVFEESDLRAQHRAIYIPAARSNLMLAVNGNWLPYQGSMTPPVSSLFLHPVYFDFSSALLREGENTLDFIVAEMFPGRGRLAPIYMDDRSHLYPVWELRHRLQIELTSLGIAICILVIVISIFIQSFLKKDTIFLWFAFFVGFWTIRNSLLVWFDIPVSAEVRALIHYFAHFGCILSALGFINHWAGKGNTRLEWFLLLSIVPIMVYAAINVYADIPSGMRHMSEVLRYLAYLAIPWIMFTFCRQVWSQLDLLAALMVGAFSISVAFGLYDFYQSSPPRLFLDFSFSTIGVMPIVLGFCVDLCRRYLNAYKAVEHSSIRLQSELNKRELELKDSYERLWVAERKTVLLNERQRIMRDMHDGVGGNLMRLLMRARVGDLKKDNMQQDIEECLQDLRLMVDSLESNENDLKTVFDKFRRRIEPVLRKHHLDTSWHIDIRHVTGMKPNTVLQIYRIMQEAVTNAVRHAGATSLQFEATGGMHEPLVIRLTDNGRGFAANYIEGAGLKSMRYRAKSMGGSLGVDSNDTGVQVTLWLPPMVGIGNEAASPY